MVDGVGQHARAVGVMQKIMVVEAAHNGSGGGAVARGLGVVRILCQLQQSAGKNRCSGAVPDVWDVVVKGEIPVGDKVGGQVLQKHLGGLAAHFQKARFFCVGVGQRKPGHDPCLPARPSCVIVEALMRAPFNSLTCGGIHQIGVERGVILPHEIVCAGMGMGGGNVRIAGVPGRLAGPEQQRQVQHRIHDDFHIGRADIELAPRLNVAAFLVVALTQHIGGAQGQRSGLLIPRQLVQSNSGQGVQKAQIVADADALIQPCLERCDVVVLILQERSISGVLGGQTHHTGVERGSPDVVFLRRVAQPLGGQGADMGVAAGVQRRGTAQLFLDFRAHL